MRGGRVVAKAQARLDILSSRANDPGWTSNGDRIVRDRLRDHRAGTDHTMLPDIRHDGRMFADPGIAADGDATPPSRLLPDGNVEAFDPVLAAPVHDRDVGTHQHVVLERHRPEAAIESHIDVTADLRRRVR